MLKQCHWLVLGPLAALTACAGSPGPFAKTESYHALGHEPGWIMTMENKRLRFVTSSPATNLEAALGIVETSQLGRRYRTDGLTVDMAAQPCHDVRSGIAFSDTVLVTADAYSYRGCGGDRLPLLDR